MWSLKYQCCKECGTSERKHLGRGLCELCYQKSIERRHSPVKIRRGLSSNLLTEEFLIENYLSKSDSLSDIATKSNCSRQFVLKKIKEFDLPLRSKSSARKLALKKGKIKFDRVNEKGDVETIILNNSVVNHHFFSTWTPQMAYVLGVVCTDGNISPGLLNDPNTKDTIRIGRLTISQKEPELLEKVLNLMNSKTKLLYRKRREFSNTVSGETYYFHLNSNSIYNDLIKLGLTKHKSLTLKFPPIPEEFVNHFVRGCWDGDGSVYTLNNGRSINASFVSGSLDFISGILSYLVKNGLKETRLNKHKGNSYYFRYTGKQCGLLAKYLYNGADETMWLNRKYELFKEYL